MATYKAEFLAHYYEGRVRPRAAYAMGFVADWARIASRAPRVANFLSHAPILGRAAKLAAGVSQRREIPRFANQTFRAWFRQHEPGTTSGTRVLLWPDTFNNYFLPETAQAAVHVLENAGCRVAIPDRILCCGRPLYDYGMLPAAKRRLEETFEALEREIQAGTPVVFLEPSCAAVFRDEMLSLYPDRPAARRLSQQVFLFDEYLQRIGYHPPRLERRAILHGHCHRKALMGMQPEQEMLGAMGVEAELLDSGCCGMAGSFGYERDHYDVSVKVGEHALLPRVRSSPAESIVVADGFSCREQIAQTTNRRAMHLAEVLAMALPRAAQEPAGQAEAPAPPRAWKWMAAAAAAVVLAAAILIRRR